MNELRPAGRLGGCDRRRADGRARDTQPSSLTRARDSWIESRGKVVRIVAESSTGMTLHQLSCGG